MKNFDDLIYVNPNALDKEVCKNIIERYERDDRKFKGKTTLGDNTDVKKCMDLPISNLDGWKDIDDILFKSSSNNLDKYTEQIKVENRVFWNTEELRDSGYLAKRYKPGDYFNWHSDRNYDDGWSRVVGYIWYLNTITEGGYTEFAHGTKIYPKAGQLIMFPSSWTFPHRGVTPIIGNKYIITSFMYSKETYAYQ